MKTSRKLILAIMAIVITIITCILTVKVISASINNFNFDNWKPGNTMEINVGYLDADSSDDNEPDSFHFKNNRNFFCIERTENFWSAKYRIGAIIKIVDDEITEASAWDSNKKKSVSVISEAEAKKESASAKKYNWVLGEILAEAEKNEDKTIVYTDADGKKHNLNRTRNYIDGEGDPVLNIQGDPYQWALWQHWENWKYNVFATNSDNTFKNSLLNTYLPPVGDNGSSDKNGKYAKAKGTEIRKSYLEKYNNIDQSSEDISVDITLGTDATLTNINIDNKSGYVALGPINITYSGTISKELFKVYFDNNTSKIPSEIKVCKYVGTELQTISEGIGKVSSGEDFYIAIPESNFSDKTKINISTTVTGETERTTTVYVLQHVNNIGSRDGGQTLMYFNQTSTPKEETDTLEYKINLKKEVTLQKQNTNGTPLEGVKFEILDTISQNTSELITDSEGNSTKVTLVTGKKYILKELENNLYGYKKGLLKVENIAIIEKIAGSEKENDVTKDSNISLVTNNSISFSLPLNADASGYIIKIKNEQELTNVEILKVGENDTPLEDVEFKIKNQDGYIQLIDSKGRVDSIKGTAIINPKLYQDGTSTSYKMYDIDYVSEKDATWFKTDKDGKITIKNLEINKSSTEKYTYTAYEIANHNYGYASGKNAQREAIIKELKLNETNQIKIVNEQDLNNLSIKKVDEANPNIILSDVGFIVEILAREVDGTKYLALYNKDEKLQKEVKGEITINSNNNANSQEYHIEYVKNVQDATTFKTGDDGILTINNLEVYAPETGKAYQYRLTETYNENEGYVIDPEKPIQKGWFTLEKEQPLEITITNPQKYTKISGYVWIEKPYGKDNAYDGVYKENTYDVILTDLYKTDENGEYIKPEIPVEIKLLNKSTGDIKDKPDEFDADGKYTFTEVEIANLKNYEVIFEYNGFYYTTTIENLTAHNGSKVKEVADERTNLNNKFATVQDTDSYENYEDNKNEVISTDGNVEEIKYSKDRSTSTVSEVNFTTISANTDETGYDLSEKYAELVNSATEVVTGIENINMGLVLREQPKLAISSDIHSVSIGVNQKYYTYYYQGRKLHEERINNDEFGVDFELKNGNLRYSRTVYSSDVKALEKGTDMSVSVRYEIPIKNQSNTLTSNVHEIINYFDAEYKVLAIGLGLNDSNNEIINQIDLNKCVTTENIPVTYGEGVSPETNKKYNSIKIPVEISLEESEVETVYIEFSVSKESIIKLLEKKSTYYNATEIMSYTTKYGENTGKAKWLDQDKNVNIITETEENNKRVGQIYAGIDERSQLGNIKLELIKDSRDQGETPILNAEEFEFDTTFAPAFLLEATEARIISGTIFEDVDSNNGENDKEKLGDGIFDADTEKTVSGVKVELYKLDGNLAKYSDGETEVATKTDENGNYQLGKYNKETGEILGIIPGDYRIKYTYSNGETYIVPNVENKINVMDYKSTIIKSDKVKEAFVAEDKEEQSNRRWFATEETTRYSDARDKISLRNEYSSNVNITTVNNSTYNELLKITEMEAYTPIMDIGIEFTEADEAKVDEVDFTKIKKLENIDFGIIERPDIDITIKKEITNFEIIASNDTKIIGGNPTTESIRWVRYVEKPFNDVRAVSAEIESDLLHGAQLNLEYSITLENNSDLDYLENDYYYYGINGETEVTSKAQTVVDYLDKTLIIDEELTPENVWALKEVKDLYNIENEEQPKLVTEDVYNELKTGKYQILTTDVFKDVGAGQNKTVNLYVSRLLANSKEVSEITDSNETNRVEIIELKGKRTIKGSIPGNYVPTEAPIELDEDRVDLIITPPTGMATNYILYIIAGAMTFIILIAGIVIIKKKVIR